jgi:hypothetical protein
VMGAKEVAVETAPGGRTTLRWTSDVLPGLAKGAVLPGRWYKEVLEPTSTDARIVAEFEDGAPAAVVSTFGEGRTLMVGTYLSAAYQTGQTPEAAAFFGGLLDWAGVSPPIVVSGGTLEVRHLESARDLLLFALNHGTQRADARITLRRKATGETALNLVDARRLALTHGNDDVSLAVQVEAGAAAVIRMARA